jgi:hypothetical protein
VSRAVVVFLLAIGAGLAQAPQQKPAPVQPVPFSHKAHAGTLKLACATCHPNPDPGELMTIAPAADCMRCHESVKNDSPAIRKLAAFAKNGREMRWARVVRLPSNIIFSHRDHVKAGAACAECHGPVAEREQLAAEKDLSMAGCMSCHRARKASLDCNYCHEQPGK